MSYLSEVLTNKTYQENVVIQLYGEYFSICQPDSGLVIKPFLNKTIASCVVNPTTVDLRRVSTTISTFSFKIVDRYNSLSQIIQGTGANVIGQQVRIFIGRVNVGMDFSEYKELPVTRIKKIDYSDNAYNISSSEETDRIDKEIYQIKTKLAVNILAATTVITASDSLASWPASGNIIIEKEVISYSGIDLLNNYFTGCSRAQLSSVAKDYDAGSDIYFFETVAGNPIDIILQLLTSGSGVGAYDVLDSGCAIDPSLIDITGIEQLKADHFSTTQVTCYFYNIDSALKLIEDQLLTPFRLRMVTNQNSKITIKQMDAIELLGENEITDESIVKNPKWSVDDNKITNKLQIDWDFNEITGKYLKSNTFTDATSIATYGEKPALKYSFKYIREAQGGYDIIFELQKMLLNRLSVPIPEISLNTQMDKSGLELLERVKLITGQVPEFDGSINFSNEVELISMGVNQNTGDVSIKLAFTSGSFNRFCYIAPSDMVMSVLNQKTVTLPAGRGDQYRVGWIMRLYDNTAREYEAGEPVNEIVAIAGDQLIFANDFLVTLSSSKRLKFANYDEVTESQKRYCFISDSGLDFSDSKRTYVVTL